MVITVSLQALHGFLLSIIIFYMYYKYTGANQVNRIELNSPLVGLY